MPPSPQTLRQNLADRIEALAAPSAGTFAGFVRQGDPDGPTPCWGAIAERFDTDFTDNAQYWVGESLYGKKLFAEAIEAWNTLFRDYPSSDKLPDARVKKGMALERLGRRSQALVEYRYVIDRFPNSPAARIARERLNP